MKKILLLLAMLLHLTLCQSASPSEPVVSKLRSLGRYTGWGWSYRGYNHTCGAFPYSNHHWNGLAGNPISSPNLVSTGSLQAPPYVTWLPKSAQATDLIPLHGQDNATNIADLPFEKRQILQPTR